MVRIGLSRSLTCAGVLALFSSPALAAAFADTVVSYTPGTAGATFRNAAAALGAPDGVTGENAAASNYFGFPNVLSPFSPAYQGDEIVQIGEGGQLTLRLSNYLNVGAGKRLGVVSNVGLIDTGTGQTGATAANFGGGAAEVRVSKDGQTWTDLGNVTFNIPSLYYTNSGPYDAAPPASPTLTDFGVPFEGSLASFNAKNYAGVIDTFKTAGGVYSGGGTWLDLSATGLDQIAYVQFQIPDDGNASTDNRLAIDSVAIANGATGAAVPEPATSSFAAAAMTLLLTSRRRPQR